MIDIDSIGVVALSDSDLDSVNGGGNAALEISGWLGSGAMVAGGVAGVAAVVPGGQAVALKAGAVGGVLAIAAGAFWLVGKGYEYMSEDYGYAE